MPWKFNGKIIFLVELENDFCKYDKILMNVEWA